MTIPSIPEGPARMTEPETVTIPRDDLEALMRHAAAAPLSDEDEGRLNDLLARCADVLKATQNGSEEDTEPPLPPGQYARVEIAGFRQNTGWVTEETRFGVQVAVVRDWNGTVTAEVAIGPGSRVVYLPTPLKRPGPMAALTAGDDADGSGDPWETALDDDESREPF